LEVLYQLFTSYNPLLYQSSWTISISPSDFVRTHKL